MRPSVIPGRRLLTVLAALAVLLLITLLVRVPVTTVLSVSIATLATIGIVAGCDYAISLRAWRRSSPRLLRRLPSAFAVGVRQTIHLIVELEGTEQWRCAVYDHADPSLTSDGLPTSLSLRGGTRFETSYTVIPTRRGEVTFAPADLRVRTRWGLCDLLLRAGARESRRVYPDFAQIARYAWLAGDRRLQTIGIKAYQQRGEGTDFKQLSEYRTGDSVRHIDWRATLRQGKPIVREFQDERDQCVLLLVDCGRRMRADDRSRRHRGDAFRPGAERGDAAHVRGVEAG
jgi:uncharacterized protein (DUF58 family)